MRKCSICNKPVGDKGVLVSPEVYVCGKDHRSIFFRADWSGTPGLTLQAKIKKLLVDADKMRKTCVEEEHRNWWDGRANALRQALKLIICAKKGHRT